MTSPFGRVRTSRARRALVVALLLVGAAGVVPTPGARAASPSDSATPRATCGPGSNPETAAQGRVSAADAASGRAVKGYTCNVEVLSHYGSTGGYRVHRYVDTAGHECAFYDTTLLFPTNALGLTSNPDRLTGLYVLDMSDPRHPVQTASLETPAMQSPHESVSLNTTRGLLAADMGYPTFNPGFVDLYDVSHDCRHPVLQSSTPLGILGHEGGFSPDGRTFWASSTGGKTITALDVSNPKAPVPLWVGTKWVAHGFNISDDGNRLYLADIGNFDPTAGLTILDVSQIQKRMPNPQVPVIAHLSWPDVSIPQTAIPVRIGGHSYLVEVDEFARALKSDASAPVGAARMIDIADEQHPKVVSNIRLEVNTPTARAGAEAADPGANNPLRGYAGHYCAVPSRVDPGIVACSFILSGLRVFDIRDPYHPKEIAYANFPVAGGATSPGAVPSAYVMCAAAFVPERGEIWYSDGNSGFYALRVTNGVWPFGGAAAAKTPAVGGTGSTGGHSGAGAGAEAPRSSLPTTGGGAALGTVFLLLGAAVLLRRLRRPLQQ